MFTSMRKEMKKKKKRTTIYQLGTKLKINVLNIISTTKT